jgi:hypothetical protein
MNGSLQKFEVNVRIKLAALWSSVMFCYIYGDYFELYVPGKVEGLLSGDNILNTPTKLFLATGMLTIPALMISLSVLLSPKVCRILNIIVGAFFSILMTLIAITSIAEWRGFYVFLAIVETIITSAVI